MVQILHEINYIAIFMLLFMTVGIASQQRKSGYNYLLVLFYIILAGILFSSWNTRPDLSYRYPDLSLYDMPLVYLLGPVLFLLYTYGPHRGLSSRDIVHFIPAFVASLATIPYFRLDAEAKRYRIHDLFINRQLTEWDIIYAVGVLITCAYVFYLAYSFRNLLKIHLVKADQYLQFFSFTVFIAVIVALSALSGIITRDYTWYRIAALVIAMGLHVYFILGFRYPRLHESMITMTLQRNAPEQQMPRNHLESLAGRLNSQMTEMAWYKDESLSLSMLAEKLNVSIHQLSDCINSVIGKNFNLYINTFRVDEARRRLAANEDSILNIAFDSGFNSKATFNRTFKQITGQTPKEYRASRVSEKAHKSQ